MSRKNTIELPAARYAELQARNRAARTADPRKGRHELFDGSNHVKLDLPKTGIPAHVAYPSERLEARFKRTSKPLKAPVPTEHAEQAAVIQWWAVYAAQHKLPECLLFAIPNGANKSIASAAKFKREGLRKGVPDLMLAIPRGRYHGLFMEMKRLTGSRATDEQRNMANLLRAQGNEVFFCYGAAHAIRVITDYLALKV